MELLAKAFKHTIPRCAVCNEAKIMSSGIIYNFSTKCIFCGKRKIEKRNQHVDVLRLASTF